MTLARRLTLTLVVTALVALAAYGVVWSQSPSSDDDRPASAARENTHKGATPRAQEPTAAEPESPSESAAPEPDPTTGPTTDPVPEQPAEPAEPVAGPPLLAPGDEGDDVRKLQARLRQIDWFEQDVTGVYGDVTTAAVEGFQAKREIAVTGAVDQETIDRLNDMTSEPTAAELDNQLGDNVPGALDPRCTTGRALCIDKTSQTLRWVIDGQVVKTVDVRFGSEYTPTREGAFQVEYKSRDHVSSLYGSSMPFAMFFSGGQAVHYSSDFAAVGYGGASHGCVNVRDYDAVAWLFDRVDVGDDVIVYRS